MGFHVGVATVFVSRLKRAGLPLHKGMAILLRAEVGVEVLGSRPVGTLRPQVQVKVALALGFTGAEQVRQVAAGQVHAARGGVVVDLRLVVLRMQRGTEINRRRDAAVEEPIGVGVEVFVSRQAGTFSAARAVTS